MSSQRYPGRSYVTTRQKAVSIRFEQLGYQSAGRWPCLTPSEIYAIGLPDPILKDGNAVPFTQLVRCRQCTNCLLHRQNLWTARAMDEVRAASRTWFGTLTVRPEERFKYSLVADLLGPTRQSCDKERFRQLATLIGMDITKMFKRMRKAGLSFRYLLVCEAHKDGFPHFHMLLHEVDEPIRKASLDGVWTLGFSNWKLVNEATQNAAVYACKYLSKSALTRVRSSARYGRAHLLRSAANAAKSVVGLLQPSTDERKEDSKPETPAVQGKEKLSCSE